MCIRDRCLFVCSRLKKRDKGEEREKEAWDDVGEKRFIYVNDGGVNNTSISNNMNSSTTTSSNPVVETKKVIDKKKEIEESLANRPMVLDKLGGYVDYFKYDFRFKLWLWFWLLCVLFVCSIFFFKWKLVIIKR